MIASLLLTLALQAAAPPAPPAHGAPPGQPTIVAEPVAMMIAAFDADGDARVDRDEFDRGVTRSFQAAVKGGDALGYIAFSDWAERWLGDRSALPSPFETDRDGDGKITQLELEGRFAQFFDRFDANKDGVLTRTELLTVRASAYGMREEGGRRRRR